MEKILRYLFTTLLISLVLNPIAMAEKSQQEKINYIVETTLGGDYASNLLSIVVSKTQQKLGISFQVLAPGLLDQIKRTITLSMQQKKISLNVDLQNDFTNSEINTIYKFLNDPENLALEKKKKSSQFLSELSENAVNILNMKDKDGKLNYPRINVRTLENHLVEYLKLSRGMESIKRQCSNQVSDAKITGFGKIRKRQRLKIQCIEYYTFTLANVLGKYFNKQQVNKMIEKYQNPVMKKFDFYATSDIE